MRMAFYCLLLRCLLFPALRPYCIQQSNNSSSSSVVPEKKTVETRQ